ncbi:NAD-dependent epimerase/dehydratase family protein [Streptomyces sp. NPDC012637]|uniref:NAD-dependent epimerase/dehydratase family protein n=1 Tax=Streptomyces sp. NPDC012637 TaxID=3364842 RepID=UPI0036E87EBD
MTLRVVVTGGTGFIGSKVLRALREPGAELRALARNPPPGVPGPSRPPGPPPQPGPPGPSGAPRLSWLPADLSRPESLRGVCEGADVLLHLASRISGTEEECAAVNVDGTAALMDEARRCGVERIVHLSTAAVYGPGPHRGIGVNEKAPAPASPASRTRLLGERAALDAGATVLRPGLVTGTGDRWVVPALAALLEQLPGRWDGGSGLLSLVDADDLARLVAALAVLPHRPPAGIFHAAHPRPVRNGDLMAALGELGVLPTPGADLSWETCVETLRRSPRGVSERQFELLAGEHWFRSDDIWPLADCPPGPGPLARLRAAAPWYRGHLAARRATADT